MSALFVLIGISIFVAAGFLAAFLWSVKNGQYDDDYTPSVRMLFDDDNEPATGKRQELEGERQKQLTKHKNPSTQNSKP